jgi:hypothetical protein
MRGANFGIVIVVMIASLLSGCGRPADTDVTSSPEYNFQSFAGSLWKTKVKTALADMKYRGNHEITLLPPDCFDPTHPRYKSPTGMEKVVAELPVGTRVRIERLTKDNGNWGGVQVTVSLIDTATSLGHGEIIYLERGLLAKNRFIFQGSSESKEWGVAPDLLEKAE